MDKIRFGKRTLIVCDEQMKETLRRALQIATSDVPVLIVGESGSGKELVARYIHEKSHRAKFPMVSVNCAAIPDGLMEAELFGFERGAFTGAIQSQVGKFERASGSTLLLDELSEMSFALQAKLLRVLQENEIDRLGGKGPIAINTRIIATTNKDPWTLMKEGKFREDLYYRLNVIRINCSPLGGRESAILALSRCFLEELCEFHEKQTMSFDESAVTALLKHRWPGNIRELRNTIERAVLLTEGPRIGPEQLEFLPDLKDRADNPCRSLAEMERQLIESTLEQTHGHRNKAAEELGISVRTLHNKLKQYGA